MELHFEDQPYQLAAIDAAVGLFDGQARVPSEDGLLFSADGIAASANRSDLSDAQILGNLRAVQALHSLPQDDQLQQLAYMIDTAKGTTPARFSNFSVEMETGTGKTYVYIRTALELGRRYGMRKFVIVVPSVAIREGVLKTFEVTRRHFRERFPDIVYRANTYRSDRLERVSRFAESSDIEFLVVTLDSFNRDSNIMRQRPDAMGGVPPLHIIQATRPIVILDEPQNMESALSQRSIASLYPLFALRYSATHRNAYNAIYRLTPYQAYRSGLVKQIRVAAVTVEHDANQPVVRVLDVIAQKRTVIARLGLQVLAADGAIRDTVLSVRAGDSLTVRARRPVYDGYEVVRLDARDGTVEFANGLILTKGQQTGADRRALFDAQISRALSEHIRRQNLLRAHGVKVLTLFFIDRVLNYTDGGAIREIFDTRFRSIRHRLEEWRDREPQDVQRAYFAQKRRKTGAMELVDSSEGRPKAEDEAAFHLIMQGKERLLSFAEPVCFVFSHSALREGWDNPNVFQIVTLNESVSEMRKRQEIGRGLRLAVDQAGNRLMDPALNILTVVANESYHEYVAQLQAELQQEALPDNERAPLPADANAQDEMLLLPDRVASSDFRGLWARIGRKTQYRVDVDSAAVASKVVQRLNRIDFEPAQIVITTASIEAHATNPTLVARVEESSASLLKHVPLVPDFLSALIHQLDHSTPRMRLTRATLFQIMNGLSDETLERAMANPQAFVTAAGRIIKEVLADELVDGISYVEVGGSYDQNLLDPEANAGGGELVAVSRSVTDKVPVQSQTERRFVIDLDHRADVRLFLKIPRGLVVATPVGNYNPDWAIVVDGPDSGGGPGSRPVYMVQETKGTHDFSQLRPNEARKVRCAQAHFSSLGVEYGVIREAEEIRGS